MNVRIDKGFIISMASLFSQQKELLEEVRGIVRVKIMDRKKSGSRGGDKKKKTFAECLVLSVI